MKDFKKNEQGIAVMMTILILTSMLLVTLVTADMLQRSLRITRIAGRSYPAYLAAESGAERILWEDRKNSFDNMTIEIDGTVTFTPEVIFDNVNTLLTANSTNEIVGLLEYTNIILTGKHYDAKRSIKIRYQRYE